MKTISTMLFLFLTILLLGQKKQAEIICKVECGGCKNKIESSLSKIDGVDSVGATVGKGKVTVKYDSKKTSALELSEILADIGFKTEIGDVIDLEPEIIADEKIRKPKNKQENIEGQQEEQSIADDGGKGKKNGSKSKPKRKKKGK